MAVDMVETHRKIREQIHHPIAQMSLRCDRLTGESGLYRSRSVRYAVGVLVCRALRNGIGADPCSLLRRLSDGGLELAGFSEYAEENAAW